MPRGIARQGGTGGGSEDLRLPFSFTDFSPPPFAAAMRTQESEKSETLPARLEGSLVSALNATYRLEREARAPLIHRQGGMNIYKKLRNSSLPRSFSFYLPARVSPSNSYRLTAARSRLCFLPLWILLIPRYGEIISRTLRNRSAYRKARGANSPGDGRRIYCWHAEFCHVT